MATGLWTREDAAGLRKASYVTLIYMDITNPEVWPDRLVKLLNECQNRGCRIILWQLQMLIVLSEDVAIRTPGGRNLKFCYLLVN